MLLSNTRVSSVGFLIDYIYRGSSSLNPGDRSLVKGDFMADDSLFLLYDLFLLCVDLATEF